MLLSKIYEQVFYGELSQTPIGPGSAAAGKVAIATADYPRVISYINLGIQALCERFVVLEKEVIIQIYDAITEYQIHWDFAETNSSSTEDPLYILDSAAHPFTENVPLKILAIYNELGEDYLINPSYVEKELDNSMLAYTPEQLVVQLPFPVDDNKIFVICQACPAEILSTNVAPTTTEVDIPDILLRPLLAFIGDRYFSTIPRNNDEAIIYPNKFESACQYLEKNNLIIKDNIFGGNRFWRDGWA